MPLTYIVEKNIFMQGSQFYSCLWQIMPYDKNKHTIVIVVKIAPFAEMNTCCSGLMQVISWTFCCVNTFALHSV